MININELEEQIGKLYVYCGDAGCHILEKEDVVDFIKENFVPKKDYGELKLEYDSVCDQLDKLEDILPCSIDDILNDDDEEGEIT